jgi:CRISPR-associated protein Csm3
MKLEKFITIDGTIRCLTGLRIGGAKEQVEVGGIDNNVIRHPITNHPYIPGSSLKGKMRTLLEYKYSPIDNDPCKCGACKVCRYFGSLRSNSPTRILVRDAHLTKMSMSILEEAHQEHGMNYVEVKTENSIERKSGRAKSPRQQERVPEGTEFNFSISIRVFNDDDPQDIVNFAFEGMELLQKDYLGSSGGRGYGQVKFKNVFVDGQLTDRFHIEDEENLENKDDEENSQ